MIKETNKEVNKTCCEKCLLIRSIEYIDQIGDLAPTTGKVSSEWCKNFDCPCHQTKELLDKYKK